jgi:two-component system sensor histidine kinase and response regulator WspE
MGLAGDLLVQSRWFDPFSESLLTLNRRQQDVGALLEALAERLPASAGDSAALLAEAREKLAAARATTTDRYVELEAFALRSTGLSERLYREVVATRMRPFGDGVEGLPRLVRDIARQLGKQAQLEIVGRATEADREILERLEAPLNHCIRNSLDHGLESPADRVAAGKPASGTIRLDARHWAGLFVVTVSDDGRGVDVERLRTKIVDRGLASATVAASLTEAELLEFLFLPGFSTASAVTDISGRGVGLDAVQDMAKSVGGVARLTSAPGKGLTIRLELPLTLSVVRTLVADVGGEPFAFPITRIARALMLERDELTTFAGHQCFMLDGQRIGVVPAHEVLAVSGTPQWPGPIPVVLLGDHGERYGLAVDRFVGEFDMVVRPLDPRLGKVQDVSASALMDDGTPVLILDTDDLMRSVATQLQGGRLRGLGETAARTRPRRRVLVVEDSVTVRELERALLKSHGYEVEVAVDGMDGWNAVRAGHYDLVVSDVDMPRMTGIELVSRIKADQRLRSLPVIIVSYKDREEDRMKGLDAGADHYMTKNSFQDDTFIRTVLDLIGAAE